MNDNDDDGDGDNNNNDNNEHAPSSPKHLTTAACRQRLLLSTQKMRFILEKYYTVCASGRP